MLKIIPGDSYNIQEKLAYQINLSQRGLRGNDLRAFIKRAGHDFAACLNDIQLHPGEVPVHQIVVGATESFGPNRNGDGFPASVCRDRAWTFEKFGRVYRNHKSHDPDDSYGRIIKAAFYEPMQRIELLIGLNGNEEAARANGGKVADREMQKLASGQDLPFSMGCRVPYDVCSGCGNQARTKQYYCDSDTCDYGGLKHNITKVASDGHILHAINPPGTTFFDDSVVLRPADRTAYAFGQLMTKAASAGVMSGAELAIIEGMTAPFDIEHECAQCGQSREVQETYKLACLMAGEDIGWTKFAHVRGAFAVLPALRDIPAGDAPGEFNQALAALAMHKVALPVRDFLNMILRDTKRAEEIAPLVQERLPGVYGRLTKSAAITRENPYAVEYVHVPQKWKQWASKIASTYSLSDEHVRRRMQLAAIRGIDIPVKLAAADTAFDDVACGEEQLAQQYALYQLGFLRSLQRTGDPEFLKIASFTCVGNRVF